MSDRLESVLKRKQREFEEDAPQFEAERNEWLHRIETLYDTFDAWLSSYREQGYLQTTRQVLEELTEELYGTYPVHSYIIIFFHRRKIVVQPKGLGVIGTKGRLDIDLEGRTVSLIVNESSGAWELATRTRTGYDTWPLTQAAFEELIEEFVAAL